MRGYTAAILVAAAVAVLLFVPGASAHRFQTAESIDMEFSESSEITIVPDSEQYAASSVSAYLYLYPRNDRRQTADTVTSPYAGKNDSALVFEWKPPGPLLSFSLSSRVTGKNSLPEIRKRVPFPADVPEELVNYTLPSGAVDSGPEITALADSLASGETDLYVVAHKIGAWVAENVEYDISYQDRAERASRVLKERRGVCSEYATLFMALARAVGIPVRYVPGMAYSNVPGKEGMGPHAWAEVYFPETGWVPFDPTFGQLGWIDATHIKLGIQTDSNESSVRYEWVSHGADLVARELSMNASVLAARGAVSEPLSMVVSPLYSDAGFGSYDVILVTLYNPNRYYVPTEVIFARTENLEMEGSPDEYILLKPGENRTLYRMVRISPDLEPGYIYTLPIGAETSRNLSAFSEITSSSDSMLHTRDDIMKYLSAMREEETKTYSSELAFSCSPEQQNIHTGSVFGVVCSLWNRGNTALNGLEVCLDSDCRVFDLSIGRKKDITFNKTAPDSEGTMDMLASARNREVSKAAKITVSVQKRPPMGIIEQIISAINSLIAWLGLLF